MPAGAKYRVPEGGRRILGRGSQAHIRVKYGKLSRKHAELIPVDGWWYIKDLGSTNGTKVNKKPVTKPVLIKDKDRIRIGGHVLEAKITTLEEGGVSDADSYSSVFRRRWALLTYLPVATGQPLTHNSSFTSRFLLNECT